jgi:hypothetical protein
VRKDLEFLGPAIKVLMKQGVRVRSAVPPQIDKSKLHKIITTFKCFSSLPQAWKEEILSFQNQL